ncbi:stalk domain-containing protein [Peptoniphilus sp. BV3AC2]|uniref:stalk domain-containing protein n=1 Tax=Peptoniphilus sp. BV3AC2 TaxID=1111133 RepID=UPI0003B813E2|nr:stalk domain-containing protein [Peptoniphilus sp. BV3AC2]ERT64482.1 copper amine oxidase N-terminal domain protein [Peptoniphilus sp. BV3AC2]
MNKKNFFATLVAALIFFNVILSANVLAYGGPQLDKDGYYTLTEYSYGDGDYSIVYKEYDLVRLVKKANGTYQYYNYGETVRLKTLSLDRGSWLNKNYNKPEKIIIPEGVEAIMDGSFENKGLTDVKFPSSLQYIGSSAFQGNKISGKISLPNVWKVDSFAFEGNKITGIDAPKLELIDVGALKNNMIEGEVYLPELKAISWYGLANDNNNNKEITLIAPKLEVVGRDAFVGTKVKNAELPKLKLVEGQGGQDPIKKYYTTKQFTVEWKAEGELKLPKQKPVVKVHLYANGEQKEDYRIVSNGAQTAEFKELPTYYIDQKEFNYTAKESCNDSIVEEGETFEYELDGVTYTFKVNYVDDKIINTVVKSEDPKREEAKKAILQAKENAKSEIDSLADLSDTEKEEAKKQIDQAQDKAAIDKIVKEAEEKNTEAGKNKVDSERLKKAKEVLDTYMKSFNEDVVDNPAIEYQDENVKDDIKKAIKRAKDLLVKKEINQAELEEMEKIPYKKVNGKKSGIFRDFTKKALVNYEVLGTKDQVNPHNGKKYTALKDNTIKIKSSLQGAGKIGENDKFFFKLNYVKEEDFKSIPQPTRVDATSTPTPKYKKQEVPSADYEVKTVDGGYEIKINKLPAGAKIIKPIVYAKLADNTYFENGTLVFVSLKEDPAIPGGESHDRPSADDDSHRRYMPSYPFFFAYGGSEKTKPSKPISETKVPVEVKMVTKLVIGSKKLVVTVDGVQKEVAMDVEPFISNNRTMLPIRFVAEALGFKVEWDDPTRTVILTDKDTVVKIPVDTNQIIVNGTVFESDVKPILKSNRTMLPIANIARALGLVDGKDIIWDGTTKEVIIKRETSK